MFTMNEDQYGEMCHLLGSYLLNEDGSWLRDSLGDIFDDKEVIEKIMYIIVESPQIGIVSNMMAKVCEIGVEVLLGELNSK